MVWTIFHYLIVAVYLAAPAAAIVIDALLARKRKPSRPGAWMMGVFVAGIIVGTSITVLYSLAVGGRVRIMQSMLASYFAVGLLLILRGFDWLIQRGAAFAFRVRKIPEKPTLPFRLRQVLAGATRVVVLFGVGLPFVMASVMTYRPKVEIRDNPKSQLGFDFQEVSFTATDGTKLSGWWMPAQRPRGQRASFGADTILICHGLASNKSNQLVLARGFVPYGYNALIFDFRAHGASGGNLTSFGDLERRDVLGAVRWIRANHPNGSEHIYGVGASMGAAALIAAAVDPSPEGRAIDAIAAYGTYDSISAELDFVANERFTKPLPWLVQRLGLPIASAQAGADIAAFSPAALVNELWPRPIMVVHGIDDQIIAFSRGQRLFDSAQQPKARLWLGNAGHNEIINDESVAERVREFFQTAKPLRVI